VLRGGGGDGGVVVVLLLLFLLFVLLLLTPPPRSPPVGRHGPRVVQRVRQHGRVAGAAATARRVVVAGQQHAAR
jgi:hypothetical protein